MQSLYVELQDQVTLVSVSTVKISDVAQLDGDEALVNKVKNLPLRKIKHTDPHSLRIGFLDITSTLRSFDPSISATSVGATETLIHYRPTPRSESRMKEILKVVFVSLILFFGAAGALMTFQTDAAVPDMLVNIHRIFTGEETSRPVLLIVSYTFGIAAGIILFFNHFASKKLKEDPTPVEVEYTTYKKEIQTCMLDILKGSDDFGQRKS